MGFRNIIQNIKKRGMKDVTNPEKIKNYFDGAKLKSEGLHLDYEEIMPYAEQLVYRSIMCNQCFKEGKCRDCQCPQPLSGMVINHECTEGNYYSMQPPQDWEAYKKETGLSFKLEYNLRNK